mmetsp:Transcript_14981/g.45353  ORF Transcript_14981/g.45353 Transcript_14981/m.45353 type:complete len:277 (+) Transcript_14981:1451-2281(+)
MKDAVGHADEVASFVAGEAGRGAVGGGAGADEVVVEEERDVAAAVVAVAEEADDADGSLGDVRGGGDVERVLVVSRDVVDATALGRRERHGGGRLDSTLFDEVDGPSEAIGLRLVAERGAPRVLGAAPQRRVLLLGAAFVLGPAALDAVLGTFHGVGAHHVGVQPPLRVVVHQQTVPLGQATARDGRVPGGRQTKVILRVGRTVHHLLLGGGPHDPRQPVMHVHFVRGHRRVPFVHDARADTHDRVRRRAPRHRQRRLAPAPPVQQQHLAGTQCHW